MDTPENQNNLGGQSALLRLLKRAYDRFLRIRGEPRQIALGFATGIFFGMTPFFGLQIILAVFFSAMFKWNKISAAIGVWISNPVTIPIIYPVTYFVGAKLVGIEQAYRIPRGINMQSIFDMITKTPEVILLTTLGGIVLGIPIAVTGYVFAFSAVRKYQDDIKRKLAAVKAKRKRKKKKAKKNRTRSARRR